MLMVSFFSLFRAVFYSSWSHSPLFLVFLLFLFNICISLPLPSSSLFLALCLFPSVSVFGASIIMPIVSMAILNENKNLMKSIFRWFVHNKIVCRGFNKVCRVDCYDTSMIFIRKCLILQFIVVNASLESMNFCLYDL